MPLTRRQRHNGLEVLAAVQERAHHHGWTRKQAHHMAVITIQCCLAESNLHNYGSTRFSDSAPLADPVPAPLRMILGPKYMGSDHNSVGVFQQQVPGWGTIRDCMTPRRSCHKFMNRATQVGVDTKNRMPNRLDIQRVQVSFDPNGFNYMAQRVRAHLFVRLRWNTKTRSVK